MRRGLRQRRAAANKGAIIALSLIVVAIGGIWVWQWSSKPPAKSTLADDEIQIQFACGNCANQFSIGKPQLSSWPQDENGSMECPKCKKKAAVAARSGSTFVPVTRKP